MSDNKLKNKKKGKSKSKDPKGEKFDGVKAMLSYYTSWDFDKVSSHLPYILFVGVLAWIHIANNHKAVHYVRSINKAEKEIQELRWEYMTRKSELMQNSKQSVVAEKVEQLGLKELKDPPHIIEK